MLSEIHSYRLLFRRFCQLGKTFRRKLEEKVADWVNWQKMVNLR